MTHEFTVIGEYRSTNQVTAEVYEVEASSEVAARTDAIRLEQEARGEDWDAFCVVRGDVQVCWAKDE